jgi:hypothetical protein
MEADRKRKLEEKETRKQEMVKTLTRIDSAKKEEWNRIHKDDTNKRQTLEKMEQEEHARAEYRQSLNEQKSGYKSILDNQFDERIRTSSMERQDKLNQELKHKGFYFECYDRDQVIGQERRKTTDFLKNTQIPLEH